VRLRLQVFLKSNRLRNLAVNTAWPLADFPPGPIDADKETLGAAFLARAVVALILKRKQLANGAEAAKPKPIGKRCSQSS
jgi:hypothetical protein